MPTNNDYGFWDADPDWADKRSARAATGRAVRPSSRPNYGTRRIGALCAAGLVAVTVALAVRGAGSDDRLSTAGPAAVAAAPADAALLLDPGLTPVTPAGAAPAITPASATPATTEPATTEPATTEPATTEPVTTATTAARARADTATASQSRPVGRATPVVETKRTCAISYKVRSGDYWISIAKASGVKLADLLTANGANVNTALYPGRSICLPANAITPTTTKPTTTTAKPTTTTAKPTATTAKPTATTTKPKPTANTAPPSTQIPATTAAPPPNSYTRAQVEQIIRNVWPDDLEDEAVRIATRESNLIPTVRNSCCFGLFQIYYGANKASLNSWGITSAAQLYDPQVNAYAAYAMYLRAGGWGPWAM